MGTILGYGITRHHGTAGLPEDTIRIHLTGSAGQSVWAFLVAGRGVRLTERGRGWRDQRWMTSIPGMFSAGDMRREQSQVV